MSRANYLIFLFLALAAFVGFDLARTLRTGRAHAKFGTITRKQPARLSPLCVYGLDCAGVLCRDYLVGADLTGNFREVSSLRRAQLAAMPFFSFTTA